MSDSPNDDQKPKGLKPPAEGATSQANPSEKPLTQTPDEPRIFTVEDLEELQDNDVLQLTDRWIIAGGGTGGSGGDGGGGSSGGGGSGGSTGPGDPGPGDGFPGKAACAACSSP